METELVMGGKEWLMTKMAMGDEAVVVRRRVDNDHGLTPKAGMNDLRMGKPSLEMTHVN